MCGPCVAASAAVQDILKLERLQAFSAAGMRLGDELPVHTLTPEARVTTRFGREASSGRQLSQTLQMLDSTASSLRKRNDRDLDRAGRRRPEEADRRDALTRRRARALWAEVPAGPPSVRRRPADL